MSHQYTTAMYFRQRLLGKTVQRQSESFVSPLTTGVINAPLQGACQWQRQRTG